MKYVTKRQRNRKKNNEVVCQRPDQTGTGDPEVATKAEDPEDPEHVSADEMDEEKDQATSLPVPFLGLEFTATRNPLKPKKFVVTRSLALQTTGGFRRQSSVPVHNFRNYSTSSSYIGTTTTTTTTTTTRCYSVQTIESVVAAKELMQHYCHHSNPLTLGNFMDLKGFQTANRNRRKAHSEVKDPPKSKIKKKSVESQPEEYSTPSTSSVTPSNSNSNSGSLLEEPAMDSTPGPSHHQVNGNDPPETKDSPTTIETLAIHDASLDIGPVVPIAGLDEAKRRAIRREIGEAIGALVGGTILEIPSLEPGNTPFHLSFLDGWLHGTGIRFANPEDSDDEFEVDENAPLKPIGYEARMRRIKSGGPSPRERAAERSRITFGTVEWLGHSDAPQLSIADGVRRIIFRAPFNPDSNRDYPGHWMPSIWSVDEEVVRLCMGDDVSIWPEIHTNLIPPQQRKRSKALARQNASRHPDVVPRNLSRNDSSSFQPQQRQQKKKQFQKKQQMQHYPKQQLQHVSESQLQQVSESQLKHVSDLQLKHFTQPEEQRPVQHHHQHHHQPILQQHLEVDPHVQQQLQALWQQHMAQQHQQNHYWMPPNAPSLPNHQQQAFLQPANLPPDHIQAIMQQQQLQHIQAIRQQEHQQHLQHMQAIYQQEQQQQLQHIQAIRQQEQQQQLQHMQANYLQEQQQQELHKLQEQHKQQQQQMLQQHQHQQQQLLQQQRQHQQQQQHLMQQQQQHLMQQQLINPIHHQVQHPVQVQVQQQMHFPVPVPMQLPVQQQIQLPVQVPMALPVQVPMQLPVQQPIQPPVQQPIQPPIQQPLEEPPEKQPPQSSQEEPQASSSQSQPNHPSSSRFHRNSDNFSGWKKLMDDACHAWNVEVFPDDLSEEILDCVRMYAIHGEKFFDMPMGKRYKATLEPIGPVATRPIGGRCSRLGQNRQTLRFKLKFQHPKVKYTPSPYRLSGRMEIRPTGTRPTRNTWYGHPNTFYTKAQVVRIRKYQKKKKSGAKGSSAGANHSGEGGASGSGSGSGNNSGATGSSSESGENEDTSPKEDFQLSKANFPPLPPPNQKRKD